VSPLSTGGERELGPHTSGVSSEVRIMPILIFTSVRYALGRGEKNRPGIFFFIRNAITSKKCRTVL
jgi:hypothetical protein